MRVHCSQQGGQENGPSSNKGQSGAGTRQGLAGDRSLECPRWCPAWLWELRAGGRQTGYDCHFPRIVHCGAGCWSRGKGPAWAPGNCFYCLFFLVSFSRVAKSCSNLVIILGAKSGSVWLERGDVRTTAVIFIHPKGRCGQRSRLIALGFPESWIGSVGGSDREAEESIISEIKFHIKHFLGMPISKLLMSLNLSIHILYNEVNENKTQSLDSFQAVVRHSSVKCWEGGFFVEKRKSRFTEMVSQPRGRRPLIWGQSSFPPTASLFSSFSGSWAEEARHTSRKLFLLREKFLPNLPQILSHLMCFHLSPGGCTLPEGRPLCTVCA